jgi:hypothetical protein
MDTSIDFADALHLARSGRCRAFFSFDEKLARSSKRIASIAVHAP